jgi:hypothetical protein
MSRATHRSFPQSRRPPKQGRGRDTPQPTPNRAAP